MKIFVPASLLCLLLVALVAPVYASITLEALINDSFHISFDFRNLNSTMYYEIKANPEIFNSTSIPRTIIGNLEKQNLKKVSWSQTSAAIFNDDEKSIHVEFYLEGLDILSYTLNKATLSRTYNAKTNWIRFDIKLTNAFTLDFATYFDTPISTWQRINYTVNGNVHSAFYYNSTAGAAPFDASCYFILPITAMNINAIGDTLTFEMPPLLEDKLIDSPILILGAIIIVNIVVIVYRKVRK